MENLNFIYDNLKYEFKFERGNLSLEFSTGKTLEYDELKQRLGLNPMENELVDHYECNGFMLFGRANQNGIIPSEILKFMIDRNLNPSIDCEFIDSKNSSLIMINLHHKKYSTEISDEVKDKIAQISRKSKINTGEFSGLDFKIEVPDFDTGYELTLKKGEFSIINISTGEEYHYETFKKVLGLSNKSYELIKNYENEGYLFIGLLAENGNKITKAQFNMLIDYDISLSEIEKINYENNTLGFIKRADLLKSSRVTQKFRNYLNDIFNGKISKKNEFGDTYFLIKNDEIFLEIPSESIYLNNEDIKSISNLNKDELEVIEYLEKSGNLFIMIGNKDGLESNQLLQDFADKYNFSYGNEINSVIVGNEDDFRYVFYLDKSKI